MSEQLRLAQVRHALTRLEETIIFGPIERAQFKQNRRIYETDAFGDVLGGHSLVGLMLLETERAHAKLRRYTSPDEHPFFDDLPEPILPGLSFDSPLVENDINLNSRLRPLYEREIVPFICEPGDDQQYGSSAVNDINCLQVLSKRIHYGKFVAESKFRERGQPLLDAMRSQDRDAVILAITDIEVEDAVLARVQHKADTYCRELERTDTVKPDTDPSSLSDAVVDIYRRWIIPLNKEVQVQYLLRRRIA